MEIPYSRWYRAIFKRRSRRQFDASRPISDDLLKSLRDFCAEFRPFRSARAELIIESTGKVFKGVVGSYGKIKDAPAFIAFIGNMSDEHVQERVGYTGEGVLLEATALGLATCWVGGFFRPEVVASLVNIAPDERVLAVTPVGYVREFKTFFERLMAGIVQAQRRHPLARLVTGLEESQWPDWVKASLEATRRAPSAINRQPWGFHAELDSITVFVRTSGPEFSVSKRLDCGIAMLHIEAGALSCGMKGEWEFLAPPQVAKFRVK